MKELEESGNSTFYRDQVMRESVALTKEQQQKRMRTGLGAMAIYKSTMTFFFFLSQDSAHFSAFPNIQKNAN